jgi:uncharacterized DUF497 family protein
MQEPSNILKVYARPESRRSLSARTLLRVISARDMSRKERKAWEST